MDHKLAEIQKSVEKYTLDELPPEDRSQFEEHMFDCPVCSDLVRQNFIVTENLKAALLDEEKLKARQPVVHRSSWRDLLRWPSLMPSAAALVMACFIGYQHFDNPDFESPALLAVLPPQMEPLRTASRGALTQLEVDPQSSIFVLLIDADQLPSGPFRCELNNSQGKSLLPEMQGTKLTGIDLVSIPLPTKSLSGGEYQLQLHSLTQPELTKSYAFAVRLTENRH